jgi:HK97 family phage portal protein
MTALQVGTVFSAVNIISDGVSSLPVHVYQKAKIAGRASKSIATDNVLYDLINKEPNPEMTSAVFFKTLMVHDLLWGNAYAEIQLNNSGAVCGIWPRNPARTRPIRILKPLLFSGDLLPAGTLMFETSDQLMDSSSYVVDQNPDMQNVGTKRLVLAENMIHIPGLSLDGRLGQSTVWLARQAFGLALATEKYGAKFFGNGARPAGILTLPSKLEDKAIDTLRRSWAEAHGGENQFKVAVLEQGVKYEKIAATPEEGQMLETRRYEREEICAIFGVPAHMVCAQEKGGKSNVEQSSIEFVLYCLHPWLNRYQQEFGRKLFSGIGRSAGKYEVRFDTRKLMYPDAAARSTFYSQGKQWGFLNTNMILELEDMNPVEDEKVGETFWQPINMQDAGDPQKLGAEDQAAIDTKKATDVAEHAAQMAQETTAAATKNQMKAAEQGHGHAMEAAKVNNVHTQKMAKLAPQRVAAAAPAAGAPGDAPAAPATAAPPAKQIKRFLNHTEVRSAMAEALSEGFFFISAATIGSEISYRYARPDHAELFIVHAPCKTLEQCFIEGIAPEERGSKARAMTKDYSKTLLVMRHGQTALDPVKISDGWLDFPLSDEGRVRLITAQQYLKNIPLKNIYASSLKRTAETAAIVESGNVSNQRPVIHIVDAARTWNLGELSGTSKKESRPIVEDFMKNPDKVPVGGESRNDFLERFLPWLESMKAEVSTGGGPTLLVMSGSNLRELSTSMTGDMETWDLSEGGLLVLTFANGVWLGNVVFGLREADDDTQRIS